MTPATNLILIGTSAGGVPALKQIVQGLPDDLSAAVCIVMHLRTDGPTHLDQILQSVTTLPVSQAIDGQCLGSGQILVARPDHHLLIDNSRVRLSHEPREQRLRPSIDCLFRTAAKSYATRTIGVVLTGLLTDGTAGLRSIHEAGGTTIIQLPSEAEFDSMPESAMRHVHIDYTLRLQGMAAVLTHLASNVIVPECHESRSFAESPNIRAPTSYRCMP